MSRQDRQAIQVELSDGVLRQDDLQKRLGKTPHLERFNEKRVMRDLQRYFVGIGFPTHFLIIAEKAVFSRAKNGLIETSTFV